MKLQCSCGAKFAVDVTPEMGRNPVRFVCPQCGLDSSDFVNGLIQQELAKLGMAGAPPPPPVGATPPPPPAPAAPRLSISHNAPAPAPAPVQAAASAEPPPAPGGSRLRISHEAKPAEQAEEAAPTSKFCTRHRGVPVTEKCFVCHKPICPQCMDMFGYFCSPLCKNKADMQGLAAPEYAGQRYNVEARFWRKTGLIFGSIVGLIVLFLGAWTWYAWYGTIPHNYFKVRFEDHPAYSGKTAIVNQDQIVFLHGGTLARWDMRHNKQVWSQDLVSQQQVDDMTKEAMAAQAKEAGEDNSGMFRSQPEAEVRREIQMGLEEALLLRVSGQNVWVGNEDKLTHYDWDTGKAIGETTLPETGDELVEGDGELLMIGDTSVTHISLTDGSSHVEQIHPPGTQSGSAEVASTGGGGQAGGGLPLAGDNGKALDPNKVNQEANNLKLPAKIALPALLANAEHERQLENALKDDSQPRHHDAGFGDTNNFQLIPAPNGYVAFSTTLLEEKTVTREAMKAKPKTSALDGDVNASKTFAVANEILNDMQRDRGGDTVEEDASVYRITVHIPDATDVPDFTTNVIGAPQLIPQKTVNILVAGYTLIVLDKSNKILWQATLTYQVQPSEGSLFGKTAETGEGPAVEHGDTLYVYDQAVLTAFDLHTGTAKWRLPTVGVAGLFFDDQNMVYINTTTASPDDVKYSRQIDITKQTDDVLMKVDPQTGKTLWTAKPGGFISYLSGKFIYAAQWYDPNPTDEPVLSDATSGLEKPPYLHITRINPKNGRVMWDYYQDRAPFSIHFDHNTIELVFKKEVQVLKYITF